MLKKILIVVGCVALTYSAYSVWFAYSAKQRVDAVMAEYDKTPPPSPTPTATSTRN